MDTSSLPRVSVIVPVWNRPDDIRTCLDSLVAQTLSRDAYEIIVVDNGSSDNTAEVAGSFADVKVLREERPGSYAARNRGIAEARGAYIAFTDSDCRAHPRWLESGLRAFEANPRAGVVAGRIELAAPDPGASAICSAYERTFAFNQEKNVARGAAVTANWMSRRDLVRDLGGFRGELKSGGDFELTRRIGAAGHQIVYDPEVLVYHPARATFRELAAKTRRVTGGRMVAHGRKRSPFGWWLGLSIDGARRVRTVWASAHLAVWEKLRLMALIAALWFIGCLEVVFVTLGAEARRA